MKFKIDRDQHIHVSRRGSVDVDFASERQIRNPPITSRRLLKASSPKTLDRRAQKMLKRVFKKTNTPIKKNDSNKSKNQLRVTRVEHDFYPGEDKARPSGGMLLHETIPVDSLGDVTTPSDTARRRDELLKTRATIDELRAAIREGKTSPTPPIPVKVITPVKVTTPLSNVKSKRKEIKNKKSTTKNRKPISFVSVPSTSVSNTWDSSPPLRPPSCVRRKAVTLKRPAETIHFTTVERTQENKNRTQENTNRTQENKNVETERKKKIESTNPFRNHDNRVVTTSKIVSPSSRDTRRAAIENMCDMLPESVNGRRILAALRQEDSDRDGRISLREIRLAMKRLSDSPYDIKNKVLIELLNAFGDTGDLIEIDALSDAVDSFKFQKEDEKEDLFTEEKVVPSSQQRHMKIVNNNNNFTCVEGHMPSKLFYRVYLKQQLMLRSVIPH